MSGHNGFTAGRAKGDRRARGSLRQDGKGAMAAAVVIVIVVVLAVVAFAFILPWLTGGMGCASGATCASAIVIGTKPDGSTVTLAKSSFASPGQFISVSGTTITSLAVYVAFEGNSPNYPTFSLKEGIASVDIAPQASSGSPAFTAALQSATYTNPSTTPAYSVGTWYDYLGAVTSAAVTPAYSSSGGAPSPALKWSFTAAQIINAINANHGADGTYNLRVWASGTITAIGVGIMPSASFPANASQPLLSVQFTLSTGTVSVTAVAGQ